MNTLRTVAAVVVIILLAASDIVLDFLADVVDSFMGDR
jgi:hypothetical protein